MKPYLNKLILLAGILFIGSAFIGGCSNNSSTGLNPHKLGKVYMAQAVNNPVKTSVLVGFDTTESFVYGATYGGPHRSDDIQVRFHIDSSLVDTFNTKNGTLYALLPKSSYKLSKKRATIPAGQDHTPPLTLSINSKVNIPADKYLLPITVTVESGGIPVNNKLQTVYYLFTAHPVIPIHSDIIITGFLANPNGADEPLKGSVYDKPNGVHIVHKGGYEYLQLMALRDIDFSKTPYSVVVCNNGGVQPKRWAGGGTHTFKFNLSKGDVKKGTFFYVGAAAKRIDGYFSTGISTDISSANWIRTILVHVKDKNKVTGDGFGNSTNALFGNNAHSADGMAVFKDTVVTSSSVPIDAVFYGKKGQVGFALRSNGNGYQIPKISDLYRAVNENTGGQQPYFGEGTNMFLVPNADAQNHWAAMGGVIKATSSGNYWLTPRRNPSIINLNRTSTLSDIESGKGVTIIK